MNWFEDFEASLRGKKASGDLVGAGSADAERSLKHYRYQHQAKLREAVEETFPMLVKTLHDSWSGEWNAFWQTRPECPRSLDYFSEVFLQYWLKRDVALELKELARFEYQMDIHPWTHQRLSLMPLAGLGEESKVSLAPLDVQKFAVEVTRFYEEKAFEHKEENVLLWLREGGLRYRVLQSWEEQILRRLPEGVAVALEAAPDDAEAIGEFFQWLGQSGLIQSIV